MFTPKFIKNLYFNGDKIQAIGRNGTLTDVFVSQGSLDSACYIYSLMMLLILHKKLDWKDLIDRKQSENNSFVKSIQNEFLDLLIGIWQGEEYFSYLSQRLNDICFEANLSYAYTLTREKVTTVSRHELHKIIKAQLDMREPVMMDYSRKEGCGHAVVAIGYSKEKGNKLRLYCIDPGAPLGNMKVWNNIIDLDYFSLDDKSITDYNYQEDNVLVNKILIIKEDKPVKPGYPF